jgi:uncharacterized membrane protein YjgN (DUF898 family)
MFERNTKIMMAILVPLFIVAFLIAPAFAPQIKAAVKKGESDFEALKTEAVLALILMVLSLKMVTLLVNLVLLLGLFNNQS